jgi:hypothetical protein
MQYKIEESMENHSGSVFYVYKRHAEDQDWAYFNSILIHQWMNDVDIIEEAKALLKQQPKVLYFEE